MKPFFSGGGGDNFSSRVRKGGGGFKPRPVTDALKRIKYLHGLMGGVCLRKEVSGGKSLLRSWELLGGMGNSSEFQGGNPGRVGGNLQRKE